MPDEVLSLPDGTRVEWEAVDDEDDFGPPPTGETREEFLESLRQSIAGIKAGKGKPLAEFAEELKGEFGLPGHAEAADTPLIQPAAQDRLTEGEL